MRHLVALVFSVVATTGVDAASAAKVSNSASSLVDRFEAFVSRSESEDKTMRTVSGVVTDAYAALGLDVSKGKEAIRLAQLEQSIEDYNAAQIAGGAFHRACLVLPLTEKFDPPPGSPGHGKLQFSDKVSMPRDAGAELARRQLEVPWQFELVAPRPRSAESIERDLSSTFKWRSRPLAKAYCSPLDFRAPPNYIFVPLWMMHQLRLAPFDPVLLTWVKLRNGANIELVPHQDAFLKLANPRAILEAELKYYSAATKDSTVSLVYNGKQYDFDVKDCVGTPAHVYQPEKCDGVSIQDADVSLDLAPIGLDAKKRVQFAGVRSENDDDEDEDDQDATEE